MTRTAVPARPAPEPNEAIRRLLDHIAEELAAEYVRIIKAEATGKSLGRPKKRRSK